MRHGEAVSSPLERHRSEACESSRYREAAIQGEENAPKTFGSIREIPLLPWVLELLEETASDRFTPTVPNSCSSTPEGKPMTRHLVAKARRRTPPARRMRSKGIWFRCLRSLGIKPRTFLLHEAHLHCVGASRGREPQRTCRVLRNVGSDDRTKLREVHPKGLPRTSHRCSS